MNPKQALDYLYISTVIEPTMADKRAETAINVLRDCLTGNNTTCTWEYEDMYDYWETSCGKAFCLDGTPMENGVQFCFYCGGRLAIPIEKTSAIPCIPTIEPV